MRSNRFELPTAFERRRISLAGWHVHAHRAPSSNADARPADERIELIVTHNGNLSPGKFGGRDVERLFTKRLRIRDHPDYPAIGMSQVSAHFFCRNGHSYRRRGAPGMPVHPLGAGAGGATTSRSASGSKAPTCVRPNTGRQYQLLARLVQALVLRCPEICGVAGHHEIVPGHKTDPGARFDWPRFIAQSGLPQRFRELI